MFQGTAEQTNGSIARVALLRDGVEVDANVGPFGFPDGHVEYYLEAPIPFARDYSFQVQVTTADGMTALSTAIIIHASTTPNQPPHAEIVLETPATRFLCERVRLQARGSDPDGEVRHLYLLEGDKILASLDGPAGHIVLAELPLGVHHLVLQALARERQQGFVAAFQGQHRDRQRGHEVVL